MVMLRLNFEDFTYSQLPLWYLIYAISIKTSREYLSGEVRAGGLFCYNGLVGFGGRKDYSR
jgi:hypothetical protein